MRDLSKLLWCDLSTDEERVEFLRCGRAYETGIIAPAIVEDVANAFRAKIALKDAVDLSGCGCMPSEDIQDLWKDILNA